MTFDELLDNVLTLLQREGRVSYRALKRRCALDDDFLAALKQEIIETQKLAIDEQGRVLVWIGQPPRRATSRDLADQAPMTHTVLEGARKQGTALCCDMTDSSHLAQLLDVEDLHEVMTEVVQLMAEAIHRYEGTVNQYLGDGLIAFFGAPMALEDHALRAVQAALTIQDMIRAYNAQIYRKHGVEIEMRLGLHTGLVVVGHVGDSRRMDYTAVGHTTHLATQMQNLAEPGTILCTEAAHHLVKDYIHSKTVTLTEADGCREP